MAVELHCVAIVTKGDTIWVPIGGGGEVSTGGVGPCICHLAKDSRRGEDAAQNEEELENSESGFHKL